MGRPRTQREKDERRAKAEDRQKQWDALSLEQKLEELAARPGQCRKQLTRLMKEVK
jgi:hypothetical protein